MSHAIGIDLGGTNLRMVAVSPTGKVLSELRSPHGDTESGWKQNVRNTFERLNRSLRRPPKWIGVAAPGLPAKDARSIAHMPGRLPGLEGLSWRKLLRADHSVPVLNDAKAALLGETWLGAARGAQNAVLITLGTGVGGAAMVDGRLLHGHIGRAGHVGHISLNPRGKPDIVNTPGSLEDAIGYCTLKRRTGGRFQNTQELLNACARGNDHAQARWLASVRALAAGITSLINVLDPEVVVVGGGISRAGPALFVPLKEFLDEFEWRPAGLKVRVVPARLGDRAGAFGAAWYAMDQGMESRLH
jgi:glucokinase